MNLIIMLMAGFYGAYKIFDFFFLRPKLEEYNQQLKISNELEACVDCIRYSDKITRCGISRLRGIDIHLCSYHHRLRN